MISIEHANPYQVEEIHDLLTAQLDKPDSIKEIELCVQNYPGYVAYDERQLLVGLSYTFGVGSDVLLLHGLHVHSDYRDREIGSDLLKATEKRARTLGYSTIILTNSMLYQGVDKRSAVPFYENRGFRRIFETFNSPSTHLLLKEL